MSPPLTNGPTQRASVAGATKAVISLDEEAVRLWKRQPLEIAVFSAALRENDLTSDRLSSLSPNRNRFARRAHMMQGGLYQ